MTWPPQQPPWQGAPSPPPTPMPDPGSPPWQIDLAALLLVVRMGLNGVSMFFIAEAINHMTTEYPLNQLDPVAARTAKTVILTVAIFVAVVMGAVWLILILLNRQGRRWARILVTIGLCIDGLTIPTTVISYVRGTLVLAQLVFSVPTYAFAVVALILLWVPRARAWFNAKTAFRIARRAMLRSTGPQRSFVS